MEEKLCTGHIRRFGREYASAEIAPRCYHLIKLYANDCGCKISVMRRGGLPFLWLKLKKRKVFCLGSAMAVIMLVWMCSRIWVIDIALTDPIQKQKVSDILKENNIVCGMPKSDLDPKELQQKVLMNHGEFTRFMAELHGTRLTIDVRYAHPIPQLDPTDKVGNVVASKSGLVEKMTVRRGHPAVTEGMYVAQGQLLISGITPVPAHGNLYVYADGDVFATTEQTLTSTLPVTVTARVKTGKVTKKHCLRIFGKNFNLFFKAPDYTHYDGFISEKNLSFGGEYFLPVSLLTYQYFEVEPVAETRNPAQLEQSAKESLLAQLTTSVGEKNIIDYTYEVSKTSDLVTVTLRAKCRENIAKTEEIYFEEPPFLRKDITPKAIARN